MSDSNTPVEVQINDDLDAFTADFFGQNDVTETPASVTEDEDDDAVTDALEPNATPVDDADGTDDEDETPAPVVEKPKTPTQKRIDEVVGKQREAERQLAAEQAARVALETKLNELLAQNIKASPAQGEAENTGPTPSDVNDDGSDKYPLGDFDPAYIRDLVKFENERDRAEHDMKTQQNAYEADMEAQKQALADNWNEKIGPAKERYPDFDEVSNGLVANFDGLDQAYGEYLVSTLQSMEFGPDVLYYLAQNPDEANKIVASGPNKATVALGRIEAKFAMAEAEKVVAKPRVSSAPPVPPQNKGNNAAVIDIPDDTDDLDAFTAKMFKKR